MRKQKHDTQILERLQYHSADKTDENKGETPGILANTNHFHWLM
jgi:hypothetical protein